MDEPSKEPVVGPGPYKVTFLVRDTVSQKPKAGVAVRACRRLDVPCTEGVSGSSTTDDAGYASLDVPAGFDGYARFDEATIVPTLYFFDPPIVANQPSLGVSVAAPDTVALLSSLTGAEPNDKLGIALVTAYDCDGDPAEGVAITADDIGDAAKSFYVRDTLPSTTATDTDETGYAGFVNASPGTSTFSATIDGKTIGTVTVLVQTGSQTLARIVPSGT